MRQHLRTAAATCQIACGVLAVLMCASTVLGWRHPSAGEDGQGLFVAIVFLLGVTLLVIWGLARTRRGWLLTLTVSTAALAAAILLVTILVARPARFDLHRGLWTTSWSGAIDTLLWLLILAACLLELRTLAPSDEESQDRPRWQTAAAVVAPLALLTALTIVVVVAAPAWMVRANSRISAGAPAAPSRPSTLSGSVRWTVDLTTDNDAVPTVAGLAVPVAADQAHNAGVVMLDPTTGRIRWRYQLRGLAEAPDLQSTEGGRAVVVDFDIRDAPDDTPQQTFTVAADTGRIRAFWPGVDDEPRGNDPPVLFDHVAQGTNSVIAFSPTTGRRLWRYHPDRCADPRSVTSTPTVIIVTGRKCSGGYQLIGLDPRSGNRRWTQPASDESGPEQQLVRSGYQLEMNGGAVRRRALDTGAIDWSAPLTSACGGGEDLVAGDRTWFASSCEGDDGGRPGTISAFDLRDGRRLWQRRLDRPIVSMVDVDDQRVLALIGGEGNCTASVLTRSGNETLKSFPGDYRKSTASSFKPGSVRCENSSVLRVGDSFILRLELVSDPDAHSYDSEVRYRFIGLA